MRTVEFEHNGHVWHLLLNGAALCDIYDKFPEAKSVLDPIQGDGKVSFDAIVWMLTRLAVQGELYRRWEGQDKGPLPSETTFRLTLLPADVLRARVAIAKAVALGFGRQVDDEAANKDGPVDVGLLELTQKKTKRTQRSGAHGICSWLRSFFT